MEQPTRTTTVDDQRAEDKSLEEDARGVLARLASTPNVTVDDLGGETLPLRANDDRDAMVAAVRVQAAQLAHLTVTESPDEVVAEPENGRNCVYDAEAAKLLREINPDIKFKGSAVEMAEAMGINLMSLFQYKEALQRKTKFDRKTWSWLLTNEVIRKFGVALAGFRSNGSVGVVQYGAFDHDDSGVWRGSLRVLWT